MQMGLLSGFFVHLLAKMGLIHSLQSDYSLCEFRCISLLDWCLYTIVSKTVGALGGFLFWV